MGIREKLREKPVMGRAAAVALVVIAGLVLAKTYWPEKKADLSQAYYSDDDGATWFKDSAFRVAPFDHNGRPAVVAHVYTYDEGKKQFCAYLARFTPRAKEQLEAALADAKKRGDAPSSVGLYHERSFMMRGVEVKLRGSDHPWISYGDPDAQKIFSIQSPDGTAVDEAFVY
jgi:hypothetical protein